MSLIGIDESLIASGSLSGSFNPIFILNSFLKYPIPEKGFICFSIFDDGMKNCRIGGTFFSSVLQQLKLPRSFYSQSLLMTFDLIEGSNPNFPQESDGTHPSVLGSGLYYFWDQDYSAQFDSINLISLLSKIQSSKLRLNPFVLRSSEEDDSLFTNYLSTEIGVKSIQIGLPVLGKGSARELIDKTDVEDLRTF